MVKTVQPRESGERTDEANEIVEIGLRLPGAGMVIRPSSSFKTASGVQISCAIPDVRIFCDFISSPTRSKARLTAITTWATHFEAKRPDS